MAVKNPRNGLRYSDLVDTITENENDDRLTVYPYVGNNTYIEWTVGEEAAASISMILHDTEVVRFLSDDAVQLYDGGFKTVTTARRMDWALLPLGFRLITNNEGHGRVRWGRNASAFKVYSIATGAYRDYHAGMVVRRGEF
jgi:hypothetical protein